MSDVNTIAEVLVSVSLDPNSPVQAQAQALVKKLEIEGRKMEQALSAPITRGFATAGQATQKFQQQATTSLAPLEKVAVRTSKQMTKSFVGTTAKLNLFAGAAAASSKSLTGLASGVLSVAGPVGILAAIGLPLLVNFLGNSASEAEKLEKRLDDMAAALKNATSEAEAADIVFEKLFSKSQKATFNVSDLGFDKLEEEAKNRLKAVDDLRGRAGPFSSEIAEAGEDAASSAAKVTQNLEDWKAAEIAVAEAIKDGFAAQTKNAILTETQGDAQERLLKIYDRQVEEQKKRIQVDKDFAEDNEAIFKTLEDSIDLTKIFKIPEPVDLTKIITGEDSLRRASDGVAAARDRLRDAESNLARVRRDEAVLSAREIEDAEERIARARLGLEGTTDRLGDLEEELAELRKPASEQEIADATTAVERAQLALNRAKLEEIELEDDLTPKIKKRLNLQGLSLDEVRSNLRNVREALAAQKDGADDEKKIGKSAEELELDAIERALNIKDAEAALLEAQDAKLKLGTRVLDNQEDIRDLERDREGILLDLRDATQEVGDAEFDLNNLRVDGTSAAQALAGATTAVVGANKDLNTALGEEKRLRTELATLRQTAITDQEKLNGLQDIQAKILSGMVTDGASLRVEIEKLANADFTFGKALSNDLFGNRQIADRFKLAQFTFFNANPGQFDLFNSIVPALAQALLQDPQSDIRTVLNEILKLTGIKMPRFESGGIVTGQGPSGLLAHLGEFGHAELVGPLTQPGRFMSLLNDAVPHMAPGLRTALSPVLDGHVAPSAELRRYGNAGASSQDADQERKKLAAEIASALVAAGVTGKSETTVTSNVSVDGARDAELVARRIGYDLQRRLDRL